jgi:hypothetical protein
MPKSIVAYTALAAAVILPSVSSFATTIEIADGEADSRIEVADVALVNGAVKGHLKNRGGDEIRDMRLLIDMAFLWRDELHPGEDNPGRSVVLTVAGPLPPHGTLTFELQPNPPLPTRDDGRFEAKAHVMGYEFVAASAR